MRKLHCGKGRETATMPEEVILGQQPFRRKGKFGSEPKGPEGTQISFGPKRRGAAPRKDP